MFGKIKNRGIMQARKMFLETDRHGRLVNQPKLPPNIRMEAIFLIPEKKRKGKKEGNLLLLLLEKEDSRGYCIPCFSV